MIWRTVVIHLQSAVHIWTLYQCPWSKHIWCILGWVYTKTLQELNPWKMCWDYTKRWVANIDSWRLKTLSCTVVTVMNQSEIMG
jgi:hypothetical protein